MTLENRDFEASLRQPPIEEQGGEKVLIPPLGQLTIQQIAASDEATVDKMLGERHSLYSEYLFNKPNIGENKILPLKRLALGRLEGIHIGVLAEHADELGSHLKTPESVKVTLSRSLEPGVVERIKENSLRIRMVAIQTDPELRTLANTISKETGLGIGEMFKALPQYKKEGVSGAASGNISLRAIMRAYDLACQGAKWEAIARKINAEEPLRNSGKEFIDADAIQQAVYNNFSEKALEKIRRYWSA